jgi:hypothetical protein
LTVYHGGSIRDGEVGVVRTSGLGDYLEVLIMRIALRSVASQAAAARALKTTAIGLGEEKNAKE